IGQEQTEPGQVEAYSYLERRRNRSSPFAGRNPCGEARRQRQKPGPQGQGCTHMAEVQGATDNVQTKPQRQATTAFGQGLGCTAILLGAQGTPGKSPMPRLASAMTRHREACRHGVSWPRQA